MTSNTLTMTALVTPLNSEGQVDYDGFNRLIQHQLSNGLKDLLLLGSTGEALLLEDEEKRRLMDYAMQVPGVNWWLGCLETSLKKAQNFFRATSSLPIKGYVILTPYYIKPTQSDIEFHFRSLLDLSSHPCILYNNPSRCAIGVSEETLFRLFNHPKFIGLKECELHPLRVFRLRQKMNPSHYLLVGDDPYLPSALCAGANGVISVLSNAFPRLAKEVVESSPLKADAAESSSLWLQGCQLIESFGNPRGIKSLLSLTLQTTPQLKAPLQLLSQTELKKLKEQLESSSLFKIPSTKSAV